MELKSKHKHSDLDSHSDFDKEIKRITGTERDKK